jgi:phosphoglycolate phosphatase-like HAD superfamily hydrolase
MRKSGAKARAIANSKSARRLSAAMWTSGRLAFPDKRSKSSAMSRPAGSAGMMGASASTGVLAFARAIDQRTATADKRTRSAVANTVLILPSRACFHHRHGRIRKVGLGSCAAFQGTSSAFISFVFGCSGARMIEAAIFDVDGTLVDTVDQHAIAWQRTFAHFGHDIEFNAIRSQIGKGGDQLMPVFLPKQEVERHGKQIEAYRLELFKRDYLPNVRGFPKVRALFKRIASEGKRIALATSAKGEELEAYKKAADIADLVHDETSSDDAERSKPHPDIFEAALARLNLTPERAVIIGDSPYDAEAAGKAGLKTIGVLCGGFAETELRKAGAAQIFDDPADLLANFERSLISQG